MTLVAGHAQVEPKIAEFPAGVSDSNWVGTSKHRNVSSLRKGSMAQHVLACFSKASKQALQPSLTQMLFAEFEQ